MFYFYCFLLFFLHSFSGMTFPKTSFPVYVVNFSTKAVQVNKNITLQPKQQKILKMLQASENNALQEHFILKGSVTDAKTKKKLCSYNFVSYTMLDSYGKEYKTFLVIDRKNKKIRCRGFALEVFPNSNTFNPKGKHLTIKDALNRHQQHKKDFEENNVYVSVYPDKVIVREHRKRVRRSH